ncbi:MAG TPA: hypothetical protein VK845_16335, partial [Gemmatimonadales bacterium]|nr:hypothetical protein [Gemmatimonadales bacterium]
MFDSIFSFLFKYRPAVFAHGRLGFEPPISPVVLVVGVTILLVGVLVTYRSTRGRIGRRYFFTLTGLRT